MIHLLYREFARLRRRYYARRPHLQRRLDQPVISVGNLTTGGSGKTPVVAEIARLLAEIGERPAILSRGYARQDPIDGVVIVSDGASMLSDLARSGDEPYMLARRLPGVAVLVCPSRFLAGRLAETRLGCTVHLLDDGFQHLELRRDIDLLVTPPSDFSNVRMLPFGRFREPIDAAPAADALLVPAGEGLTAAELGGRLKVPLAFSIERRLEAPRPIGQQEAAATFESRWVFAVAGIARPERFFADLGASGWQLTGTLRFRDHHPYSLRDVDAMTRGARRTGADLILMTEKDMVRLPPASATGIPMAWVPLSLTIERGFRDWLQRRLALVRTGAAA